VSIGFNIQGFAPWVVLDNYSLAPYSVLGFTGQDFVPGEPVAVYLGQRNGEPQLRLAADANGQFAVRSAFNLPDLPHGDQQLVFIGQQSGAEILPIGTIAGGVPMTVKGETSQAAVTLWYQALELKPSAELTAYQGPPGTVVAFTGRSFAGGEHVRVHLQDGGGPELAAAVANDDGTIEHVSSYPIEGNWGDDIHFVLVGDDSHAEGTTDFKIANPAP
jgi:hypothetical protein